jgi:hypothetical protein
MLKSKLSVSLDSSLQILGTFTYPFQTSTGMQLFMYGDKH